MTHQEITATASARLHHWVELHGLGANPAPAICRIADEVASKPQVRYEIELHLHGEWQRLCNEEVDV